MTLVARCEYYRENDIPKIVYWESTCDRPNQNSKQKLKLFFNFQVEKRFNIMQFKFLL